MKAKILIAAILGLFLTGSAFAQVTVIVGTPPLWGPAGYSDARYYYLPDVESYYDVHNSRFIYYERGTWVHRKYLPRQYRSYNLYNGYKVVMTDYRGNSPYAHFKDHKVKYHKGYKGQYQKTIGNSPNNKKLWSKSKDAKKYQSVEKEKGSKPAKSKSKGHGHDNGGKSKKK